MKILIAGAGEVGFHLAKMLSDEKQDIVLIDSNAKRLEYAENSIDVLTLKGDATSITTLKSANIQKTDLLIAATSSETTNMAIAIIGKRLGARRTIARISNTEFLKYREELDFSGLGIDGMISPEELAAKEIQRLIRKTAFTDTFEFEEGQLQLIGVRFDVNAEMVDKSVKEVAASNPNLSFRPIAIHREQRTIIPRGDTFFRKDDLAYFITQPAGIPVIRELAGKAELKINNIMILGGSRIGAKSARILAEKYKVKLIEINQEKSFELADKLPKVLVINGDGRDVELLEGENLAGMDAFIAVTGNSETNIISCLAAKAKGVKKTIALVENIDYIHLSQTIGVDTMINKKLIAASNIFRFVREGEVVSITNLHGVEAEILEFEVTQKCRITKHSIRKLDLPEKAVIGGVVRHNEGIIPHGDFQIEPGDRVVIFCMPEAISKVESFFC